jgi:hypothetical protein
METGRAHQVPAAVGTPEGQTLGTALPRGRGLNITAVKRNSFNLIIRQYY